MPLGNPLTIYLAAFRKSVRLSAWLLSELVNVLLLLQVKQMVAVNYHAGFEGNRF